MRDPFRFRDLAAVAAVAATLAIGAGIARADVAPPDSCTTPGQPCTNAGPQFDQAGTCVTATCTKQVPAPTGGTMSMTYDCNHCAAGGAAGDGAGGSGGGSGGSAGGSTSPPTSKSSGCAVASERSDAGPLAPRVSLLVIAGVILAAARRRNTGK